MSAWNLVSTTKKQGAHLSARPPCTRLRGQPAARCLPTRACRTRIGRTPASVERGLRARPKSRGSGEGRSPLPNPLEPQDDCRQSQPRGESQYSHAPGPSRIARPGDGTPATPCSRCTWGFVAGAPPSLFAPRSCLPPREATEAVWIGREPATEEAVLEWAELPWPSVRARHPAGPSRPVPLAGAVSERPTRAGTALTGRTLGAYRETALRCGASRRRFRRALWMRGQHFAADAREPADRSRPIDWRHSAGRAASKRRLDGAAYGDVVSSRTSRADLSSTTGSMIS